MELRISDRVMGDGYVSREVKGLCKRGDAVIPTKVVVSITGNSQTPMVHFSLGAKEERLALSSFRNPPSIEAFRGAGIPVEEKGMLMPSNRSGNGGRYARRQELRENP